MPPPNDHIKAVIGSIGFLHKLFDLPFNRDSFRLRLTLQSLKRKLSRAPLQALPITINHLKEMYKHINVDDPEHLAIWCSSPRDDKLDQELYIRF